MSCPTWPSQIESLYESGKYSDFSIECEGKTFRLHKAVVCPRSAALAAALDGEFKEAKTKVIKIEAFDAALVERMIKYMYGFSIFPKYLPTVVSSSTTTTPKKAVLPTPATHGIFSGSLATHRASAPAPSGGFFSAPNTSAAASTTTTPGLFSTATATSATSANATTPAPAPSSDGSAAQKSNSDENVLRTKLQELVQLNAIGDYYGVSGLCSQVNQHLRRLFTDEWSGLQFLEAAERASTSTCDKELHNMFAEFAAKNVRTLLLYRRVPGFAGLVDLNDFTAEFMNQSSIYSEDLEGKVGAYKILVKELQSIRDSWDAPFGLSSGAVKVQLSAILHKMNTL